MDVNVSGATLPAFHCRQCKQPIHAPTAPSSTSTCVMCGAVIVNHDGVIDCAPHLTGTAYIPDRVDMGQLNADAAQQGWFSALIEHFHDALHKIAYISDPVRLGWLFHCYDRSANDICLCLGSSWGGLAFPLARFFKTVYSIDDDLERLRFQAIRASAESVRNLHLVRSPWFSLPFADNSVDLVVLNSVVEWISLSDLSRSPEELQSALLAEVRRVLKPEGRLYLGIENRLGIQYFLGAKDHSGISFTSLLPRPLADQLVRRHSNTGQGGAGYRTYTYTAWGYENLLRKAGLVHNTIYWAWPSYTYPRMSGPLDGRSVRYMAEKVAYQAERPHTRLLARLSLHLPVWLLGLLIRLLAPQFLIIAGKTSERPSALQAQIGHSTPPPQSFVRLTMGINAQVKTTFLLMNRANQVYKAVRVVETPSDDGAQSTFADEESEGIRGRPLRPHTAEDVRRVGTWLADYHTKTRNGMWTPDPLIDEIGALAESVDPLIENDDHRRLLSAFVLRYTQEIRAHALPRTGEHGDYTLPNLLVVENGGETALHVIDWEFQREQGNPLMDVGSFMLSLLRRQMQRGAFPAQIAPNTPPAWFIEAYGSAGALPYHLAPGYYLLRVLDRVRQQPVNHAISHLILAQWTPLLYPALAFGVHALSVSGS